MFVFLKAEQPLLGQGPLIIEASRPRSDTQRSVGLLWTSGYSDPETSTRQQTALTIYRHICPRQDSNPQSQQASCHIPTP
jgi:hypothetical protein